MVVTAWFQFRNQYLKNYTRVEMIYDPKNDTLVVVPIYGD